MIISSVQRINECARESYIYMCNTYVYVYIIRTTLIIIYGLIVSAYRSSARRSECFITRLFFSIYIFFIVFESVFGRSLSSLPSDRNKSYTLSETLRMLRASRAESEGHAIAIKINFNNNISFYSSTCNNTSIHLSKYRTNAANCIQFRR